MKTHSFSFDLPRDRIAQEPCGRRGASRLMVLDRTGGRILHGRVGDLPAYLRPGTLMVLNETRVRKARVFGRSRTGGGEVEFLLLEELAGGVWKALAQKAKRQLPGKVFDFPEGVAAEIVSPPAAGAGPAGNREEEGAAFRYLRFAPPLQEAYLEQHGHMPLPPYILRPDTALDAERYQTVYARVTGSAAAPTAGLHLTAELLETLQQGGVEVVKLTLHVGTGTFLPIRTARVEDHVMHREGYAISERSAGRLNAALQEGRTVLAVGTTVVRALESACDRAGRVNAGAGSTSLFIRPGFRFRVVSALLTNFHTPRSSLLVLVAAFAGRRRILKAYRSAVEGGYRFFSYGDAMLIQ